MAWHDQDNDDEDAAFTMVSPEDTDDSPSDGPLPDLPEDGGEYDDEEDEDSDEDSMEFYQVEVGDSGGNVQTMTFGSPGGKPPGLSVCADDDEISPSAALDGSEVYDEPGLGQVSPGTPPTSVVQAWRDEEQSLLPPGPAEPGQAHAHAQAPAISSPSVAKVRASPSRSQQKPATFRAFNTETGHAAVLSSLKTLGVSTQVHAVIESSDNIFDELSSLREEVSTLKKRLAAERRARVEGAAREALLRDRLYAVQGALPPISADVEEMASFYARVAPGYASSDKPAKVIKFFHRKAQKDDRGTDWRQYMCENLAERWGQPAFDLLDRLAKRIGVDESSVSAQSYKAAKARSEASQRTKSLAQPSVRHKRPKSSGGGDGGGKAAKKSSGGKKAAAERKGADPGEVMRPQGAASSTNAPTATARSRQRGQRQAADRAAAVGRVGKPPPEELFFGGIGASNNQFSTEAEQAFAYRPPTEALAKMQAAQAEDESPLNKAKAHIAEAKAQLASAAGESPVRGWDGTPGRAGAGKGPEWQVLAEDGEAAAALTEPAGPHHAQYAEFHGGAWKYPGARSHNPTVVHLSHMMILPLKNDDLCAIRQEDDGSVAAGVGRLRRGGRLSPCRRCRCGAGERD